MRCRLASPSAIVPASSSPPVHTFTGPRGVGCIRQGSCALGSRSCDGDQSCVVTLAYTTRKRWWKNDGDTASAEIWQTQTRRYQCALAAGAVGEVTLDKIPRECNMADMMTHVLPWSEVPQHVTAMGCVMQEREPSIQPRSQRERRDAPSEAYEQGQRQVTQCSMPWMPDPKTSSTSEIFPRG